MLDVVHLKRSYRNPETLTTLPDETDALLSHYYPDLDAMMDEVLSDASWVRDTLAIADVDVDRLDDESLPYSILWGLAWGTYLLGYNLVRKYLDHRRKPFLRALTIAAVDPGMFQEAPLRKPLHDCLGSLAFFYSISVVEEMEEELQDVLPEMTADAIAIGFLNTEIPDLKLRIRAQRYAVDHIRGYHNEVHSRYGMREELPLH